MKTKENITLTLLVIITLIIAFNGVQLYKVSALSSTSETSNSANLDITPKGVPKVYGNELGVSFDDVSPYDQSKADLTIRKLGALDVKINLTQEELKRYINILYKLDNGISCEYCCGARAVIFENGQPACGCAHSYAMRGLTKYLLTEHSNEYTDQQILEEVAKWKTLFFPAQIAAKAKILKGEGVELSYSNLASNKYRGIEKGVSGGMVGGC